MNVLEAAGTMEVCVVVSAPEKTVHIPDVVVYVQTWFFGEASKVTYVFIIGKLCTHALWITQSKGKTTEVLTDCHCPSLILTEEHASL